MAISILARGCVPEFFRSMTRGWVTSSTITLRWPCGSNCDLRGVRSICVASLPGVRSSTWMRSAHSTASRPQGWPSAWTQRDGAEPVGGSPATGSWWPLTRLTALTRQRSRNASSPLGPARSRSWSPASGCAVMTGPIHAVIDALARSGSPRRTCRNFRAGSRPCMISSRLWASVPRHAPARLPRIATTRCT